MAPDEAISMMPFSLGLELDQDMCECDECLGILGVETMRPKLDELLPELQPIAA